MKDLETWSFGAGFITRYIESESYVLIVPEDSVHAFAKCTPSEIEVLCEEEVIQSSFIDTIKSFLDNTSAQGRRAGWIYQQFLKIQAALNSSKDRLVLWDSDTIPLREIRFFDDNSKAYFFTGSEAHDPYFVMINMILGLSKTYNDSFIAQSIPMRKEWIIELCKEIQANTGASDWKHGILSKISPSLGISPFSEYETIGTYAMNRLTIPNRPIPQASPRQWLRTGYEIIGPASNFKFFHHPAFADASFVSFERSSKPFSYYSNTQMIIPALSVKSKLLTRAKNLLSLAYHTLRINLDSARISLRKLTLPVSLQSQRNESEEEKVERFLSEFFPASPLSCIVQVGANDGISNDPLRPFLPQHKGAVVLIEALPHYCDKLNDLYSTQSNVGIVNALIAAKEGERTFYYINPGVADEMDGDGPMNRWAHGQGCFSKETIISWIQQNSFRGITYRKNLQRYVESIESTSLKSVTLATLANQRQLSQIHLLVIDVQGAEMDVLSSLGELANLPSFIIYEDDSSLNPHDSKALELLLIDYGYVYIAGSVNRLWGLDSPTVSRDSLGFNS